VQRLAGEIPQGRFMIGPRQIRNGVAGVILIPVAVVVYPTWVLYRMARFLWIGLNEDWAEIQKPE